MQHSYWQPVKCRYVVGPRGPSVQVGITGRPRAGLTIYRNGRRIPLRYVVEDAEGNELLTGELRYG